MTKTFAIILTKIFGIILTKIFGMIWPSLRIVGGTTGNFLGRFLQKMKIVKSFYCNMNTNFIKLFLDLNVKRKKKVQQRASCH